ncbi:MAG: thiamine pyrophosphate-dependent enzyme [Elusimicrobia bacterium]|nr:thiamine pyrophosphate-dependent enzyme [Candidatus Liberimonas magnetica]
MEPKDYDVGNVDIAWCPGCGDHAILNILKKVLSELSINPERLVVSSGIGQAAKAPHYFKCNYFNGLHGRSLPVASAIKMSNPELVVIAESGDGCTYGEGGNHFLHVIRRNPDITHIVHNNMVYGLTKGQASPTSQLGFVTPVQVQGVIEQPFNPLAIAISLEAPFVARAFAGDTDKTKEIIKKAVLHKGYALVDILQPCVTFNKTNTFAWFKENTYYLEDAYDPHNKVKAFERATEENKLPLGIFYINEKRTPFENSLAVYKNMKDPLYKRKVNKGELSKMIETLKA